MMMTSTTCLLLAVCCLTTGVHGGFWSFSDPFESIFHPSAIGSGSPTESPPNPATGPPKPPAAASDAAASDTAASKDSAKSSEADMRKIIDEELKKYQAPSDKSAEDKDSKPASSASSSAEKTTESPADMIRRIIAEELAKALPQTPPTTPPPPPPQEPIWKSWANTKNWAKKPGPNGEAPPGFIGSLQSRFGPGGSAAANGDAGAPASGSPGFVWSQISSKWATKEPTIVPPSQIVDNGDWEMVLPPQKAVPAKSP